MKKIIPFILSLFFIYTLLFQAGPTVIYAVPGAEFAQCDLCGLCQDPNDATSPTKPGNWVACATCLYGPNAETLKLVNGQPPKPLSGRYFTQFGCVGIDITGAGGFSDANASANVVNQLLSIISGFAGGVAFIYFLYACALFMTSRGDVERVAHAKKTLSNAIIGLLFTIFAVFLVQILASQALRIPGIK